MKLSTASAAELARVFHRGFRVDDGLIREETNRVLHLQSIGTCPHEMNLPGPRLRFQLPTGVVRLVQDVVSVNQHAQAADVGIHVLARVRLIQDVRVGGFVDDAEDSPA